MSRSTNVEKKSRRTFLKEFAVAGGATALITATGRAHAAPGENETAAGKPEPRGYHETPHIRTYYDKARF